MAEIVWTREAAEWLDRVHNHIARDNPTAAHMVVAEIYEKIQMLRRQPRIGDLYEGVADREVRELLYGAYRIPYLVRSETRVEILGVFHCAMDIEQYLK